LIVPDNELFRINTMSTYNVLEAACKLSVPKILIASSVTIYGKTYCEGLRPFPHFPITESSPTDPIDPYALSKKVCETIAESFARKYAGKVDIYAMRIGRIFTPDEYTGDMFREYVSQPEKWAPHGWSYSDARDLGEMCHLAILKNMGPGDKEGGGRGRDGFVVFNAVNDHVTNLEDEQDVSKFLGRMQPGVEIAEGMREWDAPISNKRVKAVLEWKEKWNWQEIWIEEGLLTRDQAGKVRLS
jgi:nucleoside-diphosphate-sugar epimerase